MIDFENLKIRALKSFTFFKVENIEDAYSKVVIDIISGKCKEEFFFVAMKNELLMNLRKSKSHVEINDELYQLADENNYYDKFIETDFYNKQQKIMHFHIENTLGPKQREALIKNINGENNFGDPNYKQGLKKLRKLMGGSIVGNQISNIRNLRKPTGSKKVGMKKNLALVDLIRKSSLPIWALSEKYGINPRSIRRIKNMEVYKDVEC